MSDIETTTSNDGGFSAESDVGGHEFVTDAQGERGPTPNEALVADYAHCFTYAFRATAARGDVGTLGAIRTEAAADLDDEDDLAAVRFTMHVADDLTDAEIEELLAGARDLCHVHAALREGLHADVTVHTGDA
jgi:organic hydroperoxide reductase OsmC/OhrA